MEKPIDKRNSQNIQQTAQPYWPVRWIRKKHTHSPNVYTERNIRTDTGCTNRHGDGRMDAQRDKTDKPESQTY